MESLSKPKGKEKTRKEVRENLCVVNENENGPEAKSRAHQSKNKNENVPHYCADLPKHTINGLKLSRKIKYRHLKNSKTLNDDCNTKNGIDNEDYKGKNIAKDMERQDFSKEKEKKVPSVIVLHKYKKGIFGTKTEPYTEEQAKAAVKPEMSGKKTNIEENPISQTPMVPSRKNSSEGSKKQSREIKVEGKHSLGFKQSKDQNRKKRDKKVVYKTLSTNLDSKHRKRLKKLERQQILKEVASTLHKDKDIYDKIKALPLKIDENQLIFMHPSHVAKALEHFKTKKNHQERVTIDSTCNDLNERALKRTNKEEENTEASLTKLDKISSKRLRVLSSAQKLRKSVPIVLEEKSNVSLIKVSKHKKDNKKRRGKLTHTGKKKTPPGELDVGEESRESEKFKIMNNLMPNCSAAHCSVIRQNVCFGDNSIDVTNVKNKKLPKILNDSLRSKTNKVGSNLKNGPAKELNIKRIHQKEMEKLKKLVNGNNDCENQIKISTSEDESKLTFQLLKTNMNSKNLGRLRKNVYSVSDRMGKEENNTGIDNDKLYVTKRMLFYTNKESSNTSKESLNIAIRRDTEISRSGSSNNVLNVVIKQKKNSSTSTKSINSPKLAIENQCSKHCDTKSLEKMFVENYLEKMYNNTKMIKNKHLKEAECQTEENTFDTNEQGKNEVSIPFFDPSKDDVKDEFQHFLKFQLKNINPAIWRNSIINTKNEELNKKAATQPSTEITHQCRFEDHYQQFLQGNLDSLNKDQKCIQSSSYVQNNLEAVSCSKNDRRNDLKQFIKILEDDEFNLKKTKCGNDNWVGEVNASDKYQQNLNNKSENQGIAQLNTMAFDNQCQKSESEKIAEKLKNIGLTDKKSFVRVIKSRNNLESSITKANSRNILKFKPVAGPYLKKKDILNKPVKINLKENPQNVIPTKQKINLPFPENVIIPSEGIVNDGLSKSCFIKKVNSSSGVAKETTLLEKNNKNIPVSYTLNTNNFWDLEKTINFQITSEDNLNSAKQNFINVLPENEYKDKNEMISVTTRLIKNKLEITNKPSYINFRDSNVTEVGVQRKSCDLPSVPYKNVTCMKNNINSNFNCKDDFIKKELNLPWENLEQCNEDDISKLNHVATVNIPPQKKGSFVHVINKKYDTDKFLDTKSIFMVNNPFQASNSVGNIEGKIEKPVSILNGFHKEKHVIDKINAVYEFLQYLDKVLKSNSSLKLDANMTNVSNIGNFNNTLRCLCNNCMEILNKMEVNKSNNLKDKEPYENLMSKPVQEAFKVKKPIEAEIEHFQNGTTSTHEEHIVLNELKNISAISSDIKLNKGQTNPFCVIVPAEEKPRQQNYNDFFKKIDKSKVSKNITSFEFRERSYEDFIKQKYNELASKTPRNIHIRKSEINSNKVGKVINRFYKKVQQRPMTSSINYSNKCLSLNSLEKPYESESRLLIDEGNHIFESHPHDTANPQIDYINNATSKFNVDSHYKKNVQNFPNDYLASQGQGGDDPNCVPDNTLKKFLNSVNKVNSKNKLCLSCQTDLEARFCREFIITSESTRNVKLPNKKEKIFPMLKSSLRMIFKKDEKTDGWSHCKTLPYDNTRKTALQEKNKFEEKISQEKYKIESLQNPIITKTQFNVENDSPNSLYKEDINHCAKCKRRLLINSDNKYCTRELIDKNALTDSNQSLKEISKSIQIPNSNKHSPHGSIIIMKRNSQKESTTKNTYRSNSVEYLYSSVECNNENESSQEDKELDSDGWVPLNDITEIENNKISLGVDIRDMTVKRVTYLQKFPKNLSRCFTKNE